MARTRSSITTGTTENNIYFYPAGGHSHDGQNSSLIDATKYSVYDFNFGYISDNPVRRQFQINSFESLKQVIRDTVTDSILSPAGIVLQPNTLNGATIIARTIEAGQIVANTLTANEISANTITADELVSNIVLVNNVIRSNNYSAGSTGWQISNTGSAEFNNVTVRGTIAATSGNIAGWTINTSNITGGSTVLYSNGYISAANGSFTGLINASGGTFTSYITAGVTQIGKNIRGATDYNGIALDGGSWDNAWVRRSDGSFYFRAGNATRYILLDTSGSSSINFPSFSVNDSGSITSTAGTIGGWTITGSRLEASGGTGTSLLSPASGYWHFGTYDSQYAEAYLYAGAISAYAYGGRTSIVGASITTGTVTSTYYYGTFSGTFNGGTVTSSGGISGTSLSTTGGGNINADGEFYRANANAIAQRSGAAAWWGSSSTGGFLGKASSSSIRYKENIGAIPEILNPMKFLHVDIVKFKYRDGVLAEEDNWNNQELIGFIAEDINEKYPLAVTIDEEGRPDSWNYNVVIPAMMYLIKDLYKKIEILESK